MKFLIVYIIISFSLQIDAYTLKQDNNIKIPIDYRILSNEVKLPLTSAIITINLNGIYFNKFINSYIEYGENIFSIPTVRLQRIGNKLIFDKSAYYDHFASISNYKTDIIPSLIYVTQKYGEEKCRILIDYNKVLKKSINYVFCLIDPSKNSAETYYQVERSIEYNYVHLLKDADFVNLPLPTYNQFSIVYYKDTGNIHSLKQGCVTFYDTNYMIQNMCGQASTNVLGTLYETTENCSITYPYEIKDSDLKLNPICCFKYHYKVNNVREKYALCSILENIDKCKFEIRSIIKLMQIRCYYEKNDLDSLSNFLDIIDLHEMIDLANPNLTNNLPNPQAFYNKSNISVTIINSQYASDILEDQLKNQIESLVDEKSNVLNISNFSFFGEKTKPINASILPALINSTTLHQGNELIHKFENITEEISFDNDISKFNMNHIFPLPIKLKKVINDDIGINMTDTSKESEPKISQFSNLGENQQIEAMNLLKVNVTSDFNNFDVFPNMEKVPNVFGDASDHILKEDPYTLEKTADELLTFPLDEHYIINQNSDGTFTCIEKEKNSRLTFKTNGKPLTVSLMKKDPITYIKENFEVIDDTPSIIITPMVLYDNPDDKEYNSKRNKLKTYKSRSAFDDGELLNILKKEKEKEPEVDQSRIVNINRKIRKNITIEINRESKSNDCHSDESCDNQNKKYLFSLDNMKRNQLIDDKNNANTQNVNNANINNLNIIDNTNNVNHIKKFFKRQVNENNTNVIFHNHIMVSGLTETTNLTGGGLIPLDKLIQLNLDTDCEGFFGKKV